MTDDIKVKLDQLGLREIGIQQQISSLVHTKYAVLDDLLVMTDAEVDALYNQMRAEQDS